VLDAESTAVDVPSMSAEPIRVAGHEVWADEDGVVYVRTQTPHELDLESAQVLAAHVKGVAGRRKAALVCDSSALAHVRHANLACANAVLVESPLKCAIGNFLIGVHQPAVPTRMFTREEDARAWLKQFA